MTDRTPSTEGMRARKKPVVIEYMHFHSPGRECIGRIQAWISREGGQSTWHYAVSSNDFQIKTLEGWMQANVGDYIIKGVKGEFYPCKPDIFTMTYETDFAPGASDELAAELLADDALLQKAIALYATENRDGGPWIEQGRRTRIAYLRRARASSPEPSESPAAAGAAFAAEFKREPTSPSDCAWMNGYAAGRRSPEPGDKGGAK